MKRKKAFKYYLGLFFIILAFVSPALSLLVPFFDLSAATSAIIVGLLWVGAPEVFFVIGAALAGKEVLNAIKAKVKAWFALEPYAKPVSRLRYSIGLVMLIGSILGNWAFQYVRLSLDLGISKGSSLAIVFCVDLILISSFFVLGSQFWDKFCRLFVWEGELVSYISIMKLKEGKEAFSLVEKTRKALLQVPGNVYVQVFYEESDIGIEVIFKDKKSLRQFIKHPVYDSILEEYIVGSPRMITRALYT